MIQFKKNTPTDGQKDGQTLFYRTLVATAGGPKMHRESSFLVTQPATLRFSLHDFGFILLADQCDWICILLHN